MRVTDSKEIFSDVVNNTTKYSEVVSLKHIFGFSVSSVWSGTSITGSVTVQASVDGITWYDTAATTVISATGTALYNIIDAMYPYVRVKVVSGDAHDITASIKIYCKGV